MSRFFVVALLCASCQLSSTWNTDALVTGATATPYGTLGGTDGGAPTEGGAVATGFGDRLGPLAPWSDSSSTRAAPTGALTKLGTLATGAGDGPDVVLGSTGIFFNATMGKLQAVDLTTRQVTWTGAEALAPGSFATDGTSVCGFTTTGATSYAEVACLTVATGALRWKMPTTLKGTASAMNFPVEVLLHGGQLYVFAGGYGNAGVAAFDLATGTPSFTQALNPGGRALVFVGDDLVLLGGAMTVAVDPATGTTRASWPTAVSFLWQRGGKGYFQSFGKKVASYDPAAHVFADATDELATFLAGFTGTQVIGSPIPFGLTEPAADGTVYGAIVGFSGTGGDSFCRWNAETQATAWCVPGSVVGLRAHPNRLYVRTKAAGTVVDPTTGMPAPGEGYRLVFDHFAFEATNLFEVR